MREYEYEPVPGLPEDLPNGEHIVWQGSPEWLSLANRVFHLRNLGIYFALLMAVHAMYQVMNGQPFEVIAVSLSWQVALSAVGLGLVAGLAYLYAKGTVYTFTNQRLVLKSGVAVPMMVNLPWANVDSAGLRVCSDGTGDILLRPKATQKLYRMMLWPHVRPWHWRSVELLLRGIADPHQVAGKLGEAVLAHSTIEARVDKVVSTSDPDTAKDRGFGRHEQHAPAH